MDDKLGKFSGFYQDITPHSKSAPENKQSQDKEKKLNLSEATCSDGP